MASLSCCCFWAAGEKGSDSKAAPHEADFCQPTLYARTLAPVLSSIRKQSGNGQLPDCEKIRRACLEFADLSWDQTVSGKKGGSVLA